MGCCETQPRTTGRLLSWHQPAKPARGKAPSGPRRTSRRAGTASSSSSAFPDFVPKTSCHLLKDRNQGVDPGATHYCPRSGRQCFMGCQTLDAQRQNSAHREGDKEVGLSVPKPGKPQNCQERLVALPVEAVVTTKVTVYVGGDPSAGGYGTFSNTPPISVHSKFPPETLY